MKVRVLTTDAFDEWFLKLDKKAARFVARDLLVLGELGRELPPVKAKPLKGTGNIWELRTKAGGNQVRVFFAYDPRSNAVVLLGGFKNDRKLYGATLEKAQQLWRAYLEDLEESDG